MECVIPAEPDGADVLVNRRERCMDAVLSSWRIRFSIVDRFEGCEAKPRECEISANEMLPSNLFLVVYGVVYGVFVSRFECVKWQFDLCCRVVEM